MDFSTIKKTVGIFVLSMVAVSGFAQDIIARQAPSDKRLKDIRNVKLNNTSTTPQQISTRTGLTTSEVVMVLFLQTIRLT